MSEETGRNLEEARAAAAQLRTEADRLKTECLAQIASGLPAKVEGLAKGVAHSQPEVTKALGKEGVTQLRAELAEETASLAADLESAGDKIKWPLPQDNYDKVAPNKIRSALFEYMYGPRVDKLAGVFKRHGYAIQDNNSRRSQGLVLPQYLFDEGEFGPLAEALNALGAAERKVAKAKADDDRSTVDDIWGD